MELQKKPIIHTDNVSLYGVYALHDLLCRRGNVYRLRDRTDRQSNCFHYCNS